MKIKIAAENPLEFIAFKMNLVPTPLIETQIYFTVARIIMAAAELGIYEAIGKEKRSAEEIAKISNTHAHSTIQLLNALVGIGYIRYHENKYSISPKYQKWLLQESEANLIGKLRFQIMEWNYLNHLEEFVRTGKTLELHSTINSKEWEFYQQGMRDLSINASKEMAKKIPVPNGAEKMLDIGGSHGLYSIELCKKYPALSSTILELEGAVEHASKIAQRYDQSGRVKHKAGNALTDDLGENQYDIVMINNVVHHFTNEQNIALAKKIARSLKPNGIYIIGEFLRNEKPGQGGVMGAATSLYFSLTSSSGNWSESEMKSWQNAAGLKPLKVLSAMTIPGWKMIIAEKK
ncbi:MAG: class I SAM-dependent methyltransferase [Chitinophagales bacterium]